MTASAFPFLDGRTSLDGPLIGKPRPHRRGPDRRDVTDARPDRTGLPWVDWVRTLIAQVQR